MKYIGRARDVSGRGGFSRAYLLESTYPTACGPMRDVKMGSGIEFLACFKIGNAYCGNMRGRKQI